MSNSWGTILTAIFINQSLESRRECRKLDKVKTVFWVLVEIFKWEIRSGNFCWEIIGGEKVVEMFL